jgi:SAM-dependent methyltransferase
MNLPENVIYKLTENEWLEYPLFIQDLVDKFSPKRVCDIGGGANPVLPLEVVLQQEIEYTILDISEDELEKAPREYQKIALDIESEGLCGVGEFDFLLTKMLAEHVHDGQRFHKNVFNLLKPGGIAVHYYPTLYALPFLINKVIPEKLSSYLLDVFSPRARFRLGKFPAYYSWCYGPTPKMLSMLMNIGFQILEYRGLIGHSYYDRIPLVRKIHKAYSSFLAKNPSPYLTSFAQIILQKPETSP